MTQIPPEYLSEDQVNTQSISEMLQRAFIKFETDDDGDLVIEMDGYRSLLMIDTERKLLKYMLSFSISGGTDEQKDAYANRLNTDYIFASFYVREGSVVGEYYQTFEGGLLPYHVIHAIRKMHDLVPEVTARGDDDNLLGRDIPAGGGGTLDA